MSRKHTAEIFPIQEFLDAGVKPQRPLRLREGDAWIVRKEPLNLDQPGAEDPLDWAIVESGQLVNIPLIPYRSRLDLMHMLLGAMDVIQRYVERQPHAERTHIILGDPIERLDAEGVYRYWIGFAVQTQEAQG